MEQTEGDWQRLGELLIAARVGMGFTKRAGWVEHLGFTHDRTITDIENAKRSNYGRATLADIERAYGWRPGSIRSVLAGGEPTLVNGSHPETGPPPSSTGDLIEAIEANDDLLPEAKAHLINGLELLLLVQPLSPNVLEQQERRRRAAAAEQRRAQAVIEQAKAPKPNRRKG